MAPEETTTTSLPACRNAAMSPASASSHACLSVPAAASTNSEEPILTTMRLAPVHSPLMDATLAPALSRPCHLPCHAPAHLRLFLGRFFFLCPPPANLSLPPPARAKSLSRPRRMRPRR